MFDGVLIPVGLLETAFGSACALFSWSSPSKWYNSIERGYCRTRKTNGVDMLTFRDEQWAWSFLTNFLVPCEELVSVGKAMGKGYSYFTGFTYKRVIFVRCSGSAGKPAFCSPIESIESFLSRKRIKLLPYSSPFILGEKANRTFERLQQIAELHCNEAGRLRTIARADYRLRHYCLAFYDDKIISTEITRRSTSVMKNQSYEVIPFPNVIGFGSFSKKEEVSLETPFHGFPRYLTMILENGDTRLYGVTTVSGLRGPFPGVS